MNPRKTEQGVEEIGRRALGLGPLARRLLIMIDGQRDVAALQALMGGREVEALLAELESKGCIETRAAPVSVPGGVAPAAPVIESGELPARSAKQLDMGRHFIVNTLSTFTGPYAHADLMSAAMKATEQGVLRGLIPAWRAALEVVVPAKRLAQLEVDLLKVI